MLSLLLVVGLQVSTQQMIDQYMSKPDAYERDAMNRVRATLRDPDSAEFKGIKRISSTDHVYCGWVNSKNGFGGYIGYSVFFAGEGNVFILPPDASTPTMCP